MDDEPLLTNPNLAYAVQTVHATCCLAGSASYLDDIRADLRDCGISRASGIMTLLSCLIGWSRR
jgi:hypothetical protein